LRCVINFLTDSRTASPDPSMEISPLRQQLADLSSRADALRRYL
jgi:hypothetical protein